MTIRKANKDDTARIVEIFREEYAKEPYNETWDVPTATKRIENYFLDHELFVLEVDKVVQGFVIITSYIWHTGQRGFIHELVVSADFQGKGHGKVLMSFVEDYFREKGMKEINLMASNKSMAYQMYKKMNYVEENGFVSMFKEVRQ